MKSLIKTTGRESPGQIFYGVFYLHQSLASSSVKLHPRRKIVHRDLKSDSLAAIGS